jgi:hypothetical protein
MCPVADLCSDDTQQLMWGERCIDLTTGRELFCADRTVYRGHSDVVLPFWDRRAEEWFIYTCREGDDAASPRVVVFDHEGRRVWGAVDHGHMDMGWVARLKEDGGHVAMAIRIGSKTAGPSGFVRGGTEEFTFDALTGEPYALPFSVCGTLPVDLDGDGRHELVRAAAGTDCDGEVFDRHGRSQGRVAGFVAMTGKLMDLPGEHILTYCADGTVRVIADVDAADSQDATARYGHPLYAANQRLTAVGYNLTVLSGI